MTDTIAGTLANALGATVEVAQAFPSDKLDFWPAPNMMTVGEQIDHLAHNLEYVIEPIAELLKIPTVSSGTSERLQRLEIAVRRVRDVIGAVADGTWTQKIDYPGGFSMTVLQAALVMLEHDAHHRGQLIVALRMLDIEPPRRWQGS